MTMIDLTPGSDLEHAASLLAQLPRAERAAVVDRAIAEKKARLAAEQRQAAAEAAQLAEKQLQEDAAATREAARLQHVQDAADRLTFDERVAAHASALKDASHAIMAALDGLQTLHVGRYQVADAREVAAKAFANVAREARRPGFWQELQIIARFSAHC